MNISKLPDLLTELIDPSSEVLDLGCGDKRHSNYSNKTTTVDAWPDVFPDIVLDVVKEPLPFREDSFDIVTMLDFIEHIDKEEGYSLIENCKKVSRHKILVLTPLYWDDNSSHTNNTSLWCYGNPHNLHKSLWSIKDFENIGLETVQIFNNARGDMWLGQWIKY